MPRSPKSPTPLSASTPDRITARLVVRRVKDARFPDALFPIWRYHPFFTNTDLPGADADITHRQHAIIETVFADLIDGPLAHIPSGRFGANSAWVLCAAIAHNLLRAAGVLAADRYTPRTRINPAAHHRQRARPLGPPATPTDPAPAHPLALVKGLACTVAQHHRTQSTAARNTLTPAERPNRNTQEELGRPADTTHPPTDNHPHK